MGEQEENREQRERLAGPMTDNPHEDLLGHPHGANPSIDRRNIRVKALASVRAWRAAGGEGAQMKVPPSFPVSSTIEGEPWCDGKGEVLRSLTKMPFGTLEAVLEPDGAR
jgi:hypothetical protein